MTTTTSGPSESYKCHILSAHSSVVPTQYIKETDEVLHPHTWVTHKDNSSQITSVKLHTMF